MMTRYRYIFPNLVTGGRLVLAGLFPLCDQRYWLSIVLAAAFSDLVDGWLARRLQAVSWQGGLLDAVVDKVFALVVLTAFVAAGKFSFWWLPLLLLREMVVGITATYMACNRLWPQFRKMTARPAGKVATAFQFALAITVLISSRLTVPALVLATLLSALAAFDYWRLFQRELLLRAQDRAQLL